MDPNHPLWRSRSLTITPSGYDNGYSVAISDGAGAALATCDAAGTVRDYAGAVLISAPLRLPERDERPTATAMSLVDGAGQWLGGARVLNYGVGPRARKATIAAVDPNGAELARLEAVDHKGEQLALSSNGTRLATVAVERVKSGFMRKTNVYTVTFEAHVHEQLRPMVLALATRYDALLTAVVNAANRVNTRY